MSLTCFAQDSLNIDSKQTNGADSIHASHTTFSSNTLEDATKAEGDSAYIKEDYAAAIQIYEALLKNGEAADVYYNLGNSYYKIGEIAKAVLNYERALLLQPGNGDIRANLEVARAKTIDKVEPVPEVFFVSWIDPCRLAALSPHQIGMEGKVDNQQWHMAHPTEYAILMKAANGAESENNNGYCSFHELLIPNVKYRNESGVLVSSHNYKGNYWSTESNKAFSFDSQNPTAAVLGAAAPGQGYTVRCVRNNIPAARITINPPTSVNYKGAAINGLPFYVDSNVPYWKMELIKSGDHAGTSMNFDDFSFAPLATGVTHEIEGSYTQTPKAYIARRESRTEDRTFGVKFTSMHFTGEETTYYFTITQSRYSIKGIPSINGLGTDNRIKGEGGKYTIHIELTPDDVAMPTGAQLKVRYTYLSAPRGEESTVATITDGNQHGYDVELNILANDTPDVIGLSFVVYMKEKDESGYRDISSSSYSYYQNTK